MRPKWFPNWTGQAVIIVASGPSAAQVNLNAARGRAKVVAINESWRLCPWADILFAGDYKWWETNGGCPEFSGLKVSIDRRACETQGWGINRLRGNRADNRISLDPGVVGGCHSGFSALNFAVQLLPSRILLVGYDMAVEAGVHWHGPHPEGLKNPDGNRLEKWRRSVDGVAGFIGSRDIEVVNCSPISALKKYRKATLSDALHEARWQDSGISECKYGI